MPFKPREDLYYVIIAKHSQMIFNVKGASKAKGVPIIQWPQRGGDNEKFQILDVGRGWVIIKSKLSGLLLNVKGASTAKEVPIIQWPQRGGDNEKFRILDVGKGWVSFKSKLRSGHLLNVKGASKSKGAQIIQWPKRNKDNEKFKICIAVSKWEAVPAGIVYDTTEPPTNTEPVDIISRRVFRNNSPAKISETIECSITKESIFEWAMKQSLEVGVKTSFQAQIPFIGAADTEVNVTLGLEAEQRSTEAIKETYSMSREITLDSKAAIQVRGWMDWVDNFKTGFTLKIWVSAMADSIKGQRPLTSGELKEVLIANNFEGQIIDDTVTNKLLVGLRGEFNGSYGMTTKVDIDEFPL